MESDEREQVIVSVGSWLSSLQMILPITRVPRRNKSWFSIGKTGGEKVTHSIGLIYRIAWRIGLFGWKMT